MAFPCRRIKKDTNSANTANTVSSVDMFDLTFHLLQHLNLKWTIKSRKCSLPYCEDYLWRLLHLFHILLLSLS